MSPAAEEVIKAAPHTDFTEERLLVAVVSGKIDAHTAARALTPLYMDRKDPGVIKIQQAALEDIEFYRDLVEAEHHHDKHILARTARDLRRLWDRI